MVAYVSTKYSTDNFANSALTVITGFVFSKVVFVILFHLDNKKRYTKRFTGRLNLPVLKQTPLFLNTIVWTQSSDLYS